MPETFDLVEARKAIARVREHSTGPDTLGELGDLLESAVVKVSGLEGDVGTLQGQLHVHQDDVRHTRENAKMLDQRSQATLEAAESHERALVTSLADLAEQALNRIEGLELTRNSLLENLKKARERSLDDQRYLRNASSRYERHLKLAQDRSGRLEELIDRIAQMPWYVAVRQAAKVAGDRE